MDRRIAATKTFGVTGFFPGESPPFVVNPYIEELDNRIDCNYMTSIFARDVVVEKETAN